MEPWEVASSRSLPTKVSRFLHFFCLPSIASLGAGETPSSVQEVSVHWSTGSEGDVTSSILIIWAGYESA